MSHFFSGQGRTRVLTAGVAWLCRGQNPRRTPKIYYFSKIDRAPQRDNLIGFIDGVN